jgi:Phospholipase B
MPLTDPMVPNTSATQKSLQQTDSLDDLAKILKLNAFRGDLLSTNPIPFGNIDMKLYSESTLGTTEFLVSSGPLIAQNQAASLAKSSATALSERGDLLRIARSDHKAMAQQKVQPFSWSNTPVEARHTGQPDEFDFGQVPMVFDWN